MMARTFWVRVALILIAASLSLAAVAQAGAATPVATVTLRDEASVSGTQVTLGDIAQIDADDAVQARLTQVVVGQAPRPGASRDIYLPQIMAHVRVAGISPGTVTWEGGSQQVVRVKSPGRVMGAAEAAPLYATDLAAKLGLAVDRVQVEMLSWPETVVTADEPLSLRIKGDLSAISRSLATGYLNLPVDVVLGETVVATVRPRVKAAALVPALVAKTAIERGADLTPDMFTVANVKASDVAAGALVNLDDLNGARALRPVTAGAPLNSVDVAPSLLVRRGESVAIVLGQGGVSLVLTAKSLSDGVIGQPIKVQNLDSGRMFTAMVTGPGQAEIRP